VGLPGFAPEAKAEGCVPAAGVAMGRILSRSEVASAAPAQPQFSLVAFPEGGWAPAMQQLPLLAFLGQIRSRAYSPNQCFLEN